MDSTLKMFGGHIASILKSIRDGVPFNSNDMQEDECASLVYMSTSISSALDLEYCQQRQLELMMCEQILSIGLNGVDFLYIEASEDEKDISAREFRAVLHTLQTILGYHIQFRISEGMLSELGKKVKNPLARSVMNYISVQKESSLGEIVRIFTSQSAGYAEEEIWEIVTALLITGEIDISSCFDTADQCIDLLENLYDLFFEKNDQAKKFSEQESREFSGVACQQADIPCSIGKAKIIYLQDYCQRT